MSDDLATRVDAAAAAVPGVTRVYPAGGAARVARQTLTPGVLSAVREDGDAMAVEVCVGIDGDPAEVGARVATEVRRALAEHPAVEVAVRISRMR